MGHTIAAISTPAAPAGLGVVRLSGEEAIAVATRIFRPASRQRELSRLAGYTAAYGHVFDKEGDIDDCVALLFRAPHSYTGEDVVELSCHGGLYLLKRVLRAALDAGAAPAGPGEFTRRAFVNGKLDLTQAEAVMDLIAADGRLAAKTALAAREGALFRRMEAVKNDLLAAAAGFAAYVDYPDDDIPELDSAALADTFSRAEAALSTLLDTFEAGRVVREGIDTVIVGSPNVGKSTLMNLLAGCERSIVTPIAGTTRDVVEETIRLGDVALRLCDTAGIREPGDEVEAIGVRRAQERMASAALVLAVFDGSRPLDEGDRAIAEVAREHTVIAIVNKADEESRVDREYLAQRFPHLIFLSAREGTGLEALTREVAEVTGVARLDAAQPQLMSERQRLCARRCLEAVRDAAAALQGGMTLDAVSVEVDAAIAAILELTGERANEAVVNEVFSRFCVGK